MVPSVSPGRSPSASSIIAAPTCAVSPVLCQGHGGPTCQSPSRREPGLGCAVSWAVRSLRAGPITLKWIDFSLFFIIWNLKWFEKCLGDQTCSKFVETKFARFLITRSTWKNYCMSILGYFSVGFYLIMDIAHNLKIYRKIYRLQKNMIPKFVNLLVSCTS